LLALDRARAGKRRYDKDGAKFTRVSHRNLPAERTDGREIGRSDGTLAQIMDDWRSFGKFPPEMR
jgi:hypothetical protein